MKPSTWMTNVSVGLLLYGFSASGTLAQMSQKDFVNQAKTQVSIMEVLAHIYMTSRCATAATVSSNSFVTHLRYPGSQLMLGDRVVAINGRPLDVVGWTPPFPKRLSTIGPDDEIVLTVLRQGERIDIPTQCTDSLANYSPALGAYRAIAGKDFDECIEKIPAMVSAAGTPTAETMWLQNHCMLYARRIARRDWPRYLYEYERLRIEQSRWDYVDYESVRAEILGSEQYFRRNGQDRLFAELEAQLEASKPTNSTMTETARQAALAAVPALLAQVSDEMVAIPAGRFKMGSKSQGSTKKPVRSVTVRAFRLGKHEVTFEQYDVFARATGRTLPDDSVLGRGNRPVINVSWDDAKAFAAWLSEQSGQKYRLPSESEWEYAARAGSTTEYPWGASFDANLANGKGTAERDVFEYSAPVGSFPANAWGLDDTIGNVREWTEDCWHRSYARAPTDGSAWSAGDCSRRVIRGGSWAEDSTSQPVSLRFSGDTTTRYVLQGFRLARDP
jgi:formylglycine-generating enzyme required for sulfatase activity